MKLLKIVSVLLIYIAIVWGQFIEGVSHYQIQNILLFVAIALFIIAFPELVRKVFVYEYTYLMMALLFLVLSLLIWKDNKFAVVYVGIILAFIINKTNKQLLFKLLVITIMVQIILQLYELVFNVYIYTLTIYKNDKEILLNENLYSGSMGIFRAKGIFAGPLTASQFALGISFLFRKNRKVLLLSIISGILSNTRLGIIFTTLIFISSSIINKNNKNRNLLFGILLTSILLLNLLSDVSMFRLLNVFSMDDPSNHARLYYWATAFHHYLNYSDILNSLFGNSGTYSYIYNNNPENGWLALLVDNGLMGLMLFLLPLVVIIIKGNSKMLLEIIVSIYLIVVNFLVTFHLGAIGGLLYWLIIADIYECYRRNKSIIRKSTIIKQYHQNLSSSAVY